MTKLFRDEPGRYYDPDGSIARAREEEKPVLDSADDFFRRKAEFERWFQRLLRLGREFPDDD